MPKDWNAVSESGSQSEDQRAQEQEKSVKTEQNQSKQQALQVSSTHQPGHSKSAEDVKQRPKFLSDEDLVQKIKYKQIEQRKKIKIVNCRSQDLIEMIHNHKLINYLRELKRQDKPTTYIACFRTQQDLITFVQQKISNKYRFFLHPYIRTARDIEKQKEYQEKRRLREEQHKNKPTNRNRDYPEDSRNYRKEQDYRDNRRKEDYRRENDSRKDYDQRKQNNRKRAPQEGERQRGRNRPEYDIQQKEQYKRQNESRRNNDAKKEYDHRKAPQGGQRQRGRNRPEYDVDEKQQKRYDDRKQKQYEPKNPPSQKKRQQKHSSQSSVNTSACNSKPSNKQEPSKTYQQKYIIEKNHIRIFSNIYSKNRIVDEIYDSKMASRWDKIKIYVRKNGLNKVLQLAELIWDKIRYGLKELPNENSKQQFIEVVLQTKCHVKHPNSQFTLLTDASKKYFDKVDCRNKYIIQKEFSIEEYVKGFKQSQRDVCKYWKEWIMKAQNENIPNLLKLSWKLRREFYLNINIVVGKRGQVPFAVLQIQPESDKQKRPKPDTSVVNNYLN